jgi:ribose-phosphate pyrophosphokinase
VRFPIQRSKCANTAATPLFVDYVGTLGDEDLCVVSPDTGGAKRAELSRETLEAACGRPLTKAFADKHRSAGVVSGDLFVGDVARRTALVVDDLISTPAARCCGRQRAGPQAGELGESWPW